jgi:hypothetical protein
MTVALFSKELRRRAFFLYGSLVYPVLWITNVVLGYGHLIKMWEVPLIEALSSLTIILGLGFALVALLRKERPLSLCLIATALSLWSLIHSVL